MPTNSHFGSIDSPVFHDSGYVSAMPYDIQSLSLWIGVGVALIIGGIQAAGWRHRLVIMGLIAAGGLCIIAALAAPLLNTKWPALPQGMSAAASNTASWFTFLMFVAALVLFSPPRSRKEKTASTPADDGKDSAQVQAFKNALDHTNKRFDGWKDELCNRIESAAKSRDRKDKAILDEIEKIKSQIVVDLPNASTLLEAFHNLDQAVNAKVSQISQQNLEFSDKYSALYLDTGHVIYFGLLLATEELLAFLISLDPHVTGEPEDQINMAAHLKNREFLEAVERGLSATNRQAACQNVMMNCEFETDRRLEVLPPDQWPPGLNPVEVRRFFMSALQRRQMTEYLKRQLQEVKEGVRGYRNRLAERHDLRNSRR